MKTLGSSHSAAGWLLLGMGATLPFTAHWPLHWGWENGPLENLQALVLWAGVVAAVWASWAQQHTPVGGAIWRVAALVWLVMLGRELAWGAAWLPPLEMDPHNGPQFSSSSLWWRPAVPWVCGALLLLCAYWVVRGRLWARVVLRWWREGAWPWACLGVFVLAMVVSSQAEGHGGIPWLSEHITGLVAEELAEVWAYAALWWAQWGLVQHTAGWAQPMGAPLGLRSARAAAEGPAQACKGGAA